MNKKIIYLSIVSLLVLPQLLKAQNVGIGTTNPTAPLDVNGAIRIRGGAPATGKVLTSDANGLATWSTAGIVQSNTYILSDNPNDTNLLANGYVHAGSTSFNEVYDSSTVTPLVENWMDGEDDKVGGRALPTVLAIDNNRFLVFGGRGQDQGERSDGGIYDPIYDTWTPIPDMGDGLVRHNPVVIWQNGKLAVWGGYNQYTDEYHRTGKIYDPNTQIWTSMDTVNAPTSDALGTAIGYDPASNTLVLWGAGVDGPLGNRAKYDFGTNTWSAVSGTNAPASRRNMAYCIGNGKLFIMGGNDGSGALSDAYTYTIATDTWTQLPASGLSAREEAAAHYTGSDFVVWSGKDGGNPFLDGAVYNIIFNSWAPMSTTNAPQLYASYHATTFANGYLVAADGAAGAKYDPLNNTWTNIGNAQGFLHGLAGNSLCVFAYGGNDNLSIEPNVLKSSRFFWTAQPVTIHTINSLSLYLYKKN